MPNKYQGKNVTAQRPARQGDQGFDANKDQLAIQTDDNKTDRVVLRSEVTPE